MVRMKDVAREAGVSTATVSYVINGTKKVSPIRRAKVYAAIEKLGYSVNRVARSLRNRKTMTIGVVLQNISNVFFAQVLAGLEEYLKNSDYSLIFFNTNYDIDEEKRIIDSLRDEWVDGIILYTCVKEQELKDYLSLLASQDTKKIIPTVIIDRKIEGHYSNINAIEIDNFSGGYSAVSHLVGCGKSKIAHITGIKEWSNSIERMNGYVHGMRETGNGEWILIREGDFKPGSGYRITEEILQGDGQIEGLFAANDQMAVGAIKAVQKLGLSIPEDVAVVGFDNLSISALISPSLTTIEVPTHLLGVEAGKMVVSMIENPTRKYSGLLLPTSLVVRRSTHADFNDTRELYAW
jgi:DNA-binding LacI/PurR family transcriptional regulator